MSKPRLVTGLQISFLCFDPDQVDLLKVLRGGSRKIWEFHLPYWVGPSRLTCKKTFFGSLLCLLDFRAGHNWPEHDSVS